MKTVLLSKTQDKNITKFLLQKFKIPKKVVKYDKATGTTESMGQFSVYTFKDSTGRIICRNTKYKKGNTVTEISKKFSYQPCDDTAQIHTVKKINNKKTEEEFRVYYGYYNKAFGILMQQALQTPSGDIHKMTSLKCGKVPKSISYIAKWDGNAPEIRYQNLQGRKLDCPNQEYLPVFIGEQSKNRKKQKAHHLAKINEKLHDIEGITPEPQIVSYNELNKDAPYPITGDCDAYSGQVRVCSYVLGNAYTAVEAFAHEYQHAADFSDSMRLSSAYKEFMNCIQNPENSGFVKENQDIIDFVKKSAQKGLIPDNSLKGEFIKDMDKMIEKYDEVKTLKDHDEQLLEIRAMNKEQEESKKLDDLIHNISVFLENN